jgi:hypothetical protein
MLKEILNESAEHMEKLILKHNLKPEDTPFTMCLQTDSDDSIANAFNMKHMSREPFKALTISFFDLSKSYMEGETSLYVSFFIWLKINNKIEEFKQIFDSCIKMKLPPGDYDSSFFDNDSETMH